MPTTLKIKKYPAELSWVAESGKTYHVQRSADLVNWTDYAGPFEGDDALFVLAIPLAANANFRLVVSVPNGFEVKASAIVAFSGQFVELQWDNLGPAVYPAGANYVITRNGQTHATRPSTADRYRDSTVESGKTYTYEVRFYS